MAQRLKMADALHLGGDSFAVHYMPRVKRDVNAEALTDEAFEHLRLHLAHELHGNAAGALIPDDMELGVLLLKQKELGEHDARVGPRRKEHAVAHDGLHHGGGPARLRAKPLTGKAGRQAEDGADLPGAHTLRRFILCAGIDAYLGYLFLMRRAVLILIPAEGAHSELTAGELHERHALALRVARDLIHPCAEPGAGGRGRSVSLKRVQQPLHPVEPEAGAEKARNEQPRGDERGNIIIRKAAGGAENIHSALRAERDLLIPAGRVRRKVHAARAEARRQRGHERSLIAHAEVHLRHEHKNGHTVAPQQPPKRLRMRLNAVRAAYDEHGTVQHLKRPLRLGGEVGMAGRIQQRKAHAARIKNGLL